MVLPRVHPGISALLACMATAGCSTILMPGQTPQSDHRCISHTGSDSFSTSPPLQSPAAEYRIASSTDAIFSNQVISLAEVIDALSLLDNLTELSTTDRQRTIEYLELRQQLTERVLLASFEVSSGVAEVICERDRADQVAHRMEAIDSSRIRNLTLASIVLGGVAAIVSGGIGLAGGATTASDIAEVTGGILSTAFGGTALFTRSQQEFKHERNLLREVWEDPPQSSLFSLAIWRYLHRRHKEGEPTPREGLIAAWRQEGRLGKPGSKDEQKRLALFFGPGGVYSAAELHARASMLEELEATIQLMNQELEVFVRELIAKLAESRRPR